MEDEPETPVQHYPSHMQILSIPNDPDLKRAYEVYKPSAETLQLLSEENRTVYPELFIENGHLGPLKDLSTIAMARCFGPLPHPIVAESPLLSQLHYDALAVDLPLEKCYHIAEERYWKRVVLLKHHDKTLAIKHNINWKNLGVSLKLAEWLEQCPVEYWPEEEIKELALNVKEFVKEMHIKRLQSLRERYFSKFFLTDSEESSAEESSYKEDDSIETSKEVVNKNESRAAKRQRQRHDDRRQSNEKSEQKSVRKISYNMFDMEVSDSEDDGEERIVDKRNKNLYLKHIKKYNYPAHDCHHINLKFVQYLTNLETFVLEFRGPLQGRYFHQRHQRFSLNDIKNLSFGLSHLSSLKTFRLRNSSMDAEKLQTLCQALALLPGLEILDFGFDQLNDDCGFVFEELFRATKTLQSLELETNFLGEQSLHHIGTALKHYKAAKLLYLGLARNPLTDQALHALVVEILTTNHVQHLNIRGATFVTEQGVCCCVANELLGKHSPLIKLDICALAVSPVAADEIVKSLEKNKTILEIYCTDCGLDVETEIDITVLLQRNKYILEHYYLDDPTVTKEQITNWLNRTSRHPILLKVLAERETQRKCLENTYDEEKTYSYLKTPALKRQPSLDLTTQIYETNPMEFSSSEMKISAESSSERFVYAANDFGEEEFLAHVYQPGPPERYHYFKTYKQKYSIKDNIKDISMI